MNLRHRLLVLAIAGALAACGKAPGGAGAPSGDAAGGKPLLLSGEDVQTLGRAQFASGPVITGSIQPEKRADLRAEVQAVVLQVYKENGERVKRGDLLVRLDDSALRESLSSAEQAERAATQSFEQAERQFQRMKTLQAQGMSSMQAMEDAEIRRNNAQSELVAARARVATARQQLQRTETRAPFDGVVADRKVSPGDSAQIGKELVKVIDPASMRFEGLVSADRMAELKPGQTVYFKVNGYPQTDFQGTVKRIAAAANPQTRQVEVLVAFSGTQQPGVAGLYAEGRVLSQSSSALMLPDRAIQREGDQSFVWRVQDGKLAKVAVKLGERDQRQGLNLVLSGVEPGDVVLRHAGGTLAAGRAVQWAAAAAASAPSAQSSSAASAATSKEQ